MPVTPVPQVYRSRLRSLLFILASTATWLLAFAKPPKMFQGHWGPKYCPGKFVTISHDARLQ